MEKPMNLTEVNHFIYVALATIAEIIDEKV